VQSVFYAEPPSGFVYAVIDIGSVKRIQAVDIISGFYKPDDNVRRKIDFTNFYTIKWSIDGVNFFDIDPKTNNFSLSGGDTKVIDSDILGENFEARYFKLIIEDVEKIEYNPDNRPSGGVWVVAFVEISVFGDVVVRGEAKLIPTTFLTADIAEGAQTIPVEDTSTFPSGAGYAYINNDIFWHSTKSSTSFGGCTGAGAHANTIRVHDQLEGDTRIFDDTYLLKRIGDFVYKDGNINEFLDTQSLVDKRAKDFLSEFVKNHTRGTLALAYAPHLQVGNTIQVIDSVNRITRNYFVEGITHSDIGSEAVIAYYP
jgi:hypothetical protein